MSKRFETTTNEGLKAIVARRGELESRETIAENLQKRKLANTKTSIVFGFDTFKYESDAQARQKDILGATARDIKAEKKRMHDMKMHLKFHTNISFGDRSIPVDYTRDSTMADPTGHVHEYRGVLNEEVGKFIKRSNLYFGDAKPEYESVAHHGMTNGRLASTKSGAAGLDAAAQYKQTKEDTIKLTKELRASNFSFGDENDPEKCKDRDWTTDHQRGFKAYTPAEMRANIGKMDAATRADLRKCHFEFGHDETIWETDVMRSHWKIADHIRKEARDPKLDRENAKAIKLQGQRTSFIIGDDKDYM